MTGSIGVLAKCMRKLAQIIENNKRQDLASVYDTVTTAVLSAIAHLLVELGQVKNDSVLQHS